MKAAADVDRAASKPISPFIQRGKTRNAEGKAEKIKVLVSVRLAFIGNAAGIRTLSLLLVFC
jgi:hypothetical protein